MSVGTGRILCDEHLVRKLYLCTDEAARHAISPLHAAPRFGNIIEGQGYFIETSLLRRRTVLSSPVPCCLCFPDAAEPGLILFRDALVTGTIRAMIILAFLVADDLARRSFPRGGRCLRARRGRGGRGYGSGRTGGSAARRRLCRTLCRRWLARAHLSGAVACALETGGFGLLHALEEDATALRHALVAGTIRAVIILIVLIADDSAFGRRFAPAFRFGLHSEFAGRSRIRVLPQATLSRSRFLFGGGIAEAIFGRLLARV